MAASMDDVIADSLSKITAVSSKPEILLEIQDDVAQEMLDSTKSLYDSLMDQVEGASGDALPSLLVDQFDDEQVWQQLELQNRPCIDGLLASIARLSTSQACTFGLSTEDTSFTNMEEEEMSDEEDEEAEAGDSDADLAGDDDGSEDEEEDDVDEEIGAFQDADDDDESEEEKELKELLEKATAQPEDGSDNESSGSDLDFDFETETVSKSKKKKSILEEDIEPKGKAKRKTVVDDKFFSLADMEQFLEQEDRKEERKIRREKGELDEDSTDEDEDDDEDDEDDEDAAADDEARHLMYSGFFDPPSKADASGTAASKKSKGGGKKKVQFALDDKNDDGDEKEADEESENEEGGEDEDDDDDSEEGEDEADGKRRDLFGGESDSEGEDADAILGRTKNQKSSFQQRQERLKSKISELEEVSMAEKPWQLMGEVTAKVRPENSLLQEDLDFEHTTRLPPTITEETTKSLEDIILQRIKDKAFDDVERKIKPSEAPFEYKKRIVLDQEKSKMSLSQIYEQEYLKQQEKDEEEKEDPAQEEIKKMMESLFVKLDALSNFHYTPKQTAPEVKVISNQPSIAMEEVAPVNVSDAALLAPEEVKEKSKKLIGDTERTDTDKKRARREKKAKQRARQAAKEKREKAVEKLNPGLGNKYSKTKALKELEKQAESRSKKASQVTVIKESKKKAGLSSTRFFTQLQDEVSAHIQSRKGEKKKKQTDSSLSSQKFKL